MKKILPMILLSPLFWTASLLAVESEVISTYCWTEDGGRLDALRCDLAVAQAQGDLDAVSILVAEGIDALGSKAGLPEAPDRFKRVPPRLPRLLVGNRKNAFEPYRVRLEETAWWLEQPSPDQLEMPLRAIASVITGALAARRAGAVEADRLLDLAEGAGRYLRHAQDEGAHGLYPFPMSPLGRGRPFEVARRFLREADARGLRDRVLHRGWAVDDLGDGGLQFDNGLVGVAILELYAATRDPVWLASARQAADWALLQPPVPNWNYNSFSVFLLAEFYRQTGEARYLEGAKEKARLGIYPGQLQEGPQRGRWFDPHNARLVYHYVLIRGLASLVSVLPAGDPDRAQARKVLGLALEVRNAEIAAQGVSHPATVLEVLCRLERRVGLLRLTDIHRFSALSMNGRYVEGLFSRGDLPVTPDAWGLYLEYLARTSGADVP